MVIGGEFFPWLPEDYLLFILLIWYEKLLWGMMIGLLIPTYFKTYWKIRGMWNKKTAWSYHNHLWELPTNSYSQDNSLRLRTWIIENKNNVLIQMKKTLVTSLSFVFLVKHVALKEQFVSFLVSSIQPLITCDLLVIYGGVEAIWRLDLWFVWQSWPEPWVVCRILLLSRFF